MKVVTVKVEGEPFVVEVFVPVNFTLEQFKALIDDHDPEDIIWPVFCGMTAEETPDYNEYLDYAVKRSIGVIDYAWYMGEEPIKDDVIQNHIYKACKDIEDCYPAVQEDIKVIILH